MGAFNGCSLISVIEMSRLRKEICRLLSKLPNIHYLLFAIYIFLSYYVKYLLKSYYWGEKLTFSELWFSRLNKFVTMSVLVKPRLTQTLLNFKISCSNLKMRGLRAKLCVTFLLYSFWKELWRFKVKGSMHFVEQKCKL